MACVYKEICREHKCKAKIFTQMSSNLKNMIGNPDILVLFTDTVSHKMVKNATKNINKNSVKVIRSHSSSSCALKEILATHCTNCTKDCLSCKHKY